MAERTQALCEALVQDYDGDAARIWRDAVDARDLERRLLALPGIGPMKAGTLLAILGKRFGIKPAGWDEVAPQHPTLGDVDSASRSRRTRRRSGPTRPSCAPRSRCPRSRASPSSPTWRRGRRRASRRSGSRRLGETARAFPLRGAPREDARRDQEERARVGDDEADADPGRVVARPCRARLAWIDCAAIRITR